MFFNTNKPDKDIATKIHNLRLLRKFDEYINIENYDEISKSFLQGRADEVVFKYKEIDESMLDIQEKIKISNDLLLSINNLDINDDIKFLYRDLLEGVILKYKFLSKFNTLESAIIWNEQYLPVNIDEYNVASSTIKGYQLLKGEDYKQIPIEEFKTKLEKSLSSFSIDEFDWHIVYSRNIREKIFIDTYQKKIKINPNYTFYNIELESFINFSTIKIAREINSTFQNLAIMSLGTRDNDIGVNSLYLYMNPLDTSNNAQYENLFTPEIKMICIWKLQKHYSIQKVYNFLRTEYKISHEFASQSIIDCVKGTHPFSPNLRETLYTRNFFELEKLDQKNIIKLSQGNIKPSDLSFLDNIEFINKIQVKLIN